MIFDSRTNVYVAESTSCLWIEIYVMIDGIISPDRGRNPTVASVSVDTLKCYNTDAGHEVHEILYLFRCK
jgi:hypothetical protein